VGADLDRSGKQTRKHVGVPSTSVRVRQAFGNSTGVRGFDKRSGYEGKPTPRGHFPRRPIRRRRRGSSAVGRQSCRRLGSRGAGRRPSTRASMPSAGIAPTAHESRPSRGLSRSTHQPSEPPGSGCARRLTASGRAAPESSCGRTTTASFPGRGRAPYSTRRRSPSCSVGSMERPCTRAIPSLRNAIRLR
jgi:hypothetical protein